MADLVNNPSPPRSDGPTPGPLAYAPVSPADRGPFTASQLVAAVLMTLAGTAAVLALLLVLADRPDWWRGFLAALVASVLSAAASLPPLVWGLRRGLDQAAAGAFIAMGARAAVALAVAMFAVKGLDYPRRPTLLLLIVFYFAVLAVETYGVARARWNAKV